MRAVLQRVRSASVTVGGEVVGRIGPGLLVFVGVAQNDGASDVDYIADKIRHLRIFPDEDGRMNRSVVETSGAVLIISQFTLLADCRRGRRPSFEEAAPPAVAQALYDALVRRLRGEGLTVQTGVFQAHMDVELLNDGPVTMLLDSSRQRREP
jgi:D-tyrosyl-tRNA(Tyr) deacylase